MTQQTWMFCPECEHIGEALGGGVFHCRQCDTFFDVEDDVTDRRRPVRVREDDDD